MRLCKNIVSAGFDGANFNVEYKRSLFLGVSPPWKQVFVLGNVVQKA